jgi:hypothetical protein
MQNNLKRFWIYYRGTRNGMYIDARTITEAKREFMAQEGLATDSYVAGRKVQ